MKEIFCDAHGKQSRYAIVCRHLMESLNSKKSVGLNTPWEEIAADEPFEAWCEKCELVLNKEKGWNDDSEKLADFKLVCEKCYDDMKTINLTQKQNAV